MFRNSLFHFYTETESFDVSIEPKQTEDQPKKFDREHSLVFSESLGCFDLFQNSSVYLSCFDIGSTVQNTETNRNFCFGFDETNRNRYCFDLFRFKPKFLFVCFEDTLPRHVPPLFFSRLLDRYMKTT